ncbi:MAG TPA: tetratricopeptide repeat protein [Candidatus Binatia bacterium]
MPTRRARLITAALLVVATTIAFAPILRNDFINFDDPLYVTKNPLVQRGLTVESLRDALTTSVAGNWHPLTVLSHLLDWQLYGMAAGGHHLTSLVLHAASTVLLFLFLAETTGALGASAIVAACFGVHPLHVESVAWVAERKDVLSTLFFLLTIGTYARYTARPGIWRYGAILLCFALGLAAKPTLVTLPFVLLLLDVWPLRRVPAFAPPDVAGTAGPTTAWRLVVEKLPLFALSAADSAITVAFQARSGAVESLGAFPLAMRLANALTSAIDYLGQTVWPARLACFYPYPARIPPSHVAGAALLLLAITGLALRGVRRAPYLLVGWLWYLGTLVPMIGIVQVGHQSMADRYTYVPLIGIFIAAVFGGRALVARLGVRPRLVAAAVAAALVACMAATWAQAARWRTSITLFTHALAVTTDNYMAHEKLAEALDADGRHAEALEHFRETIRLTPTFAEAHVAFADALLDAHDEQGAIEHYGEAVRLKPDDATAHAKLGNALWHAGNAEGAREHFEEAARLAPDDAESLSNLGVVLLTLGQRDDALVRLDAAVRLDPTNAAAHGNHGFALAAAGRFDEAQRELEEAIRLQPGLANAHFNLGNVLFTTGHPSEAQAQFEQALAIKPDYAEAHNNLGVALERLGRVDEARAHYTEALRLRPDYASAASNLSRVGNGG